MIQNVLPHFYYFWMVAKHSSFTRAAQALRISQSAVSIQIKKLEEKLGVQLFQRGIKNRIVLSTQGAELYANCQRIFQEVEASLQQLHGMEIQGDLVVTAPPNFGSFVLVPMLKVLDQKYPRLKVSLHLTDTVIDLIKESTDLAIRFGAGRDPKLSYEYLSHFQHVLVASKDYFKKHPPIHKAKDIEKHCILVRKKNILIGGWKAWLEQFSSVRRPRLLETLAIESTHGMAVAVQEGLGIAVLPLYSTFNSLKEGDVQEILPSCHKNLLEPFFTCTPKSPYPIPKVAAFIQTLKEYLAGCCGKKGFLYRPKME